MNYEYTPAPISVFVRTRSNPNGEWKTVNDGTTAGQLVQLASGDKLIVNGSPAELSHELEHGDKISVKFVGHTNA